MISDRGSYSHPVVVSGPARRQGQRRSKPTKWLSGRQRSEVMITNVAQDTRKWRIRTLLIVGVSIAAMLSFRSASANTDSGLSGSGLRTEEYQGYSVLSPQSSVLASPDGCGGTGPYVIEETSGTIVP